MFRRGIFRDEAGAMTAMEIHTFLILSQQLIGLRGDAVWFPEHLFINGEFRVHRWASIADAFLVAYLECELVQ
jgi:hypothetical protein